MQATTPHPTPNPQVVRALLTALDTAHAEQDQPATAEVISKLTEILGSEQMTMLLVELGVVESVD